MDLVLKTSGQRCPVGSNPTPSARCALFEPRPSESLGGVLLAYHSSHSARILYMTTLSLADARANLSKLVESAVTTHERFDVTRNGDRVAVLLSADDYDALLETVDILSRPDEVAAVREGLADLASGETSSLEDVRAAMIRRGRLSS